MNAKRKRGSLEDDKIESQLIATDSESEKEVEDSTTEESEDDIFATDSESEKEIEDYTTEESEDDMDKTSPGPSPGLTSKTSGTPWTQVKDMQAQNPKELKKIMSFSGKQEVIGIENLSPYQCFQKLFPDSIYDLVANETNKYAKIVR